MMKRRDLSTRRWAITLLAVLACAIPRDATAATHGVWLFFFQTESFDNAALVSRLVEMEINEVSLSMGNASQHRALDPREGAAYDAAYTARLADFVTRAHAAGINVHGLTLQDPGFTLTVYHDFGRSLVGNLLAYNANHPAAPLDGILLDVEPWNPAVWTGCCDLITGANYDQLNSLLGDYRVLLGELRSDLDAHASATGQHLVFTTTVTWWLNDESTVPGRLPNGDASVLAASADGLVNLVFGGWGNNAAEIVAATNDEIVKAPTAIVIGTMNLSWEDRRRTIAALDLLYAGVANYRGTMTYHFATLEDQFLSR